MHNFTRSVAYFAYDAVWTLVLGLSNLSDVNYSTFDPFDVRSLENRQVGDRLRESLGTVTFLGVSVSAQCMRFNNL